MLLIQILKKLFVTVKVEVKKLYLEFYKKLGKAKCSTIESIAMDGARVYLSASKEHAPNSLLVYDKFHINKKLNETIDAVRKEELRKARKNDNEELKKLTYCGERWILLKNSNLTKNQQTKLDKLISINEPIYKSVLLKKDFLSIYKSKTTEEASLRLDVWLIEANTSKLEPFLELAQSLKTKYEMIINYFKKKISSAISEGINNKIKRLKLIA